MTRGLLFLALLAALLPAESKAETLWDKARYGSRTEEKHTRVSIEKVLEGKGDERDLLRVRVGLITLSRGEIDDPRTIVLFLRMRREMGLSQASGAGLLLKSALAGDLSLTERAWAQIELAHDFVSRRELAPAKMALSEGLAYSWRSEVRAETLILRGLLNLRLLDDEQALTDFRDVLALGAPRRVAVQAHIGQAFAYAQRADESRVNQEAKNAYVVESTRATVSRLDPFWDVKLSAHEARAARALLHYGQALVLQREEPTLARASLRRACSLIVGSAAGDESRQDKPRPPSWGEGTAQTLAAMWAESCKRPTPSAPGDNKDDF